MIYQDGNEWTIELVEEEVKDAIDFFTDLKHATETNEKTKNQTETIKHITVAIETMIAFCAEVFDCEEE